MSKLVKAAGETKSLTFYHLQKAFHKTRSLLSHLLKIKHYFFGNDNNEDDKRLRRSSVYSSIRWRHYWSTSNHVPLPEPLLFLQGSTNYYIEREEVDIVSCSSPSCNKTTVVLPDDQVEVEEERYSEVGTPPWCSSHRYDGMGMDEINRLAEMFIANCHEKFILEESYGMYQEMLARGFLFVGDNDFYI